jgi:hypothetical protein
MKIAELALALETLNLHYSSVHKRVALDVKPTLHKCLG